MAKLLPAVPVEKKIESASPNGEEQSTSRSAPANGRLMNRNDRIDDTC